MTAIKQVIQGYWSGLSSADRRWILSHIIIHKELPTKHAIFKNDDLPFDCVRGWLEETIAKQDWNQEYEQKP